MRRFTFLLALVVASVGCNADGLVDPSSIAPTGISASVQADTTPSTVDADSTSETSSDGILIGSGTRSDSASVTGIGIGSGS
jgi:hypothetical protein